MVFQAQQLRIKIIIYTKKLFMYVLDRKAKIVTQTIGILFFLEEQILLLLSEDYSS